VREPIRSERVLIDLMLREAEGVRRYVSEPKARYEGPGIEGMHLRDGLWRHVLQFLESGTRLRRSFRASNPKVPWELIHELRQEMVHNYPEVSPSRVRAFAIEEMPQATRLLRHAKFPKDRSE
jgi:uncharacterized protein with HEPN domain